MNVLLRGGRVLCFVGGDRAIEKTLLPSPGLEDFKDALGKVLGRTDPIDIESLTSVLVDWLQRVRVIDRTVID
jgi:hypothetical protein